MAEAYPKLARPQRQPGARAQAAGAVSRALQPRGRQARLRHSRNAALHGALRGAQRATLLSFTTRPLNVKHCYAWRCNKRPVVCGVVLQFSQAAAGFTKPRHQY